MRSTSLVGFALGALLAVPTLAPAQAPLGTLFLDTTPKMPLTGLVPAKPIPDFCLLKYRITTSSPQCQEFFDQGLGFFYSYTWMEASRSFETATQHDPECAMAWWGLSRALERWGKGDANKALQKASDLQAKASHREQQLILARLQEKGLAQGIGADANVRRQAAIKTLDSMLMLYDDDEEAWFYRGNLAAENKTFGGTAASTPFYKALCRVNPLHPGANHELLHHSEGIQRPALGWLHAENYIKSSPGVPHAYHMQAHLATRLGRWEKTCDRSARAIELQKNLHKLYNTKPADDWQYGHHLEVLSMSLVHDGRFREARSIQADARAANIRHPAIWFRLHLGERDWAAALKLAEQSRKTNKAQASYQSALVFLKKGDLARALPELEVLQLAFTKKKNDRSLESHLLEIQGQVLCQTGAADAGLKLLARLVDRTKGDYSHHSWGNGAYYMEIWGISALHAGRFDVAEEAFLEALAHDAGCVRAALGMQVLCEQQRRAEEAARFADLARRCWSKADPKDFAAELAAMRGETSPLRTQIDDKKTSER